MQREAATALEGSLAQLKREVAIAEAQLSEMAARDVELRRRCGEAEALAEALKVNTTVDRLTLYGCGIGDDGAAALAQALRFTTSWWK